MRESDLEKFVAVLNGLAAVKPGGKLTTEALEIWWNSMQDWTIEDFTSAASHLVRAHEFMPSPFHFDQLRKAAQPTPFEAWDIALGNCYSWRESYSTAGALIDQVVRQVGGYRALAMANVERDLPHIQRRFMEAYALMESREYVRDALPELTAPRLGFARAESGPLRIKRT